MFKERIEYDNPKNMEEEMIKENLCCDQNQNKRETIPNWKTKKREKFDQKRKILSFIRTLGITTGDIKGITIKYLSH